MRKTILFTILTALTLGGITSAHAANLPDASRFDAPPVPVDTRIGLHGPSLFDVAGDTAQFYAASKEVRLEGKLNVNGANAKQWTLLPGIGPSTADKLVAYQKKHGFKQVIHVMRVKGIGRKTFAKIEPFLSLDGETTLHVAKQ